MHPVSAVSSDGDAKPQTQKRPSCTFPMSTARPRLRVGKTVTRRRLERLSLECVASDRDQCDGEKATNKTDEGQRL